MTKMAILQEVDKCMRCNGCVLSCKRTWQMKNETIGVHTVSYDQRLAIKSQKRVDMGPFLRFSCWHCGDPPCIKRCPKNAMAKQESGAVSIDPDLCDPTYCSGIYGYYPCQVDCQNGGYPKIGMGSFASGTTGSFTNVNKAWKCTLCHGRAGATLDAKYGQPLPTRATAAEVATTPERAHEPSCVYTCPAKAMRFDTQATIKADMLAGGYISGAGDSLGSMFWASKLYYIAQPKADPLVEDHISPMVANLLSGPFAKAAIVPTLIAGGLFALSMRRTALEASTTPEEV